MSRQPSPEDVRRLAALAGVHVAEEDLEELARALAGHSAAVEPLLATDLADVQSALRFDPRWRG